MVFKASKEHLKVLDLLAMGVSRSLIAHRLKKSRVSVWRNCETLLKYGFLKKAGLGKAVFYKLTERGHELLEGVTKSVTVSCEGVTSRSDWDRLHNLSFHVPIRRAPLLWDKRRVAIIRGYARSLSERGLRNVSNDLEFDFEGVRVRSLPRSFVITLVEDIVKPDSETAVNVAVRVLDRVLDKLQLLFKGVVFDKFFTASITVGRQHHALIYNDVAQWFLRNGIRLQIKDDEGALIAVADNSKGLEELEFVHARDAERHSGLMKKAIKDITVEGIDLKELNDKVARLWSVERNDSVPDYVG